ncbi:glycerol kinase [Paenarthrobacter sp. RAF54_2]|uniref:FGGY-family carbohydrate kinase n=1 Tax=Paenarthrobacter sp. RAF54_2 TaxID=3233061 RepID=UPI003F9B3105
MSSQNRAAAGSAVVVAVDQGTSATKALVMNATGEILGRAHVSLSQQHPQPGWVEQDPLVIRDSVISAIGQSLKAFDSHKVRGVGLSTQRESIMIWDKATGQPLGPILGWQDRRTAQRAKELLSDGAGPTVQRISGLPIDPMFSALKLAWLLDSVDPDRRLSLGGKIAAGTVDSWLVSCLTGQHRIEAGNASRTQLMNLDTVDWDAELLNLFRVPAQVLPEIVPSSEPSGPLTVSDAAGASVCAVLGDSHSALYAHGVREPGTVKATYGTGSSIMGLLTESTQAALLPGLVKTLAWHDGIPRYAFEGNILATGATAMWLAQVLDIDVAHLDSLARTVDGAGGVNIVPAFAGLGAPWWDECAEASISGFNLGTSAAHLARAAFESIVLQIEDVLSAAEKSISTPIRSVLADGGPTSNSWLMQMQADLSQRTVLRSTVADLSALGVAHMAAIHSGLCSAEDIAAWPRNRTEIRPEITSGAAAVRKLSWSRAVARARWAPPAESNVDARQDDTLVASERSR